MKSEYILYISYDGLCEPLGQSQIMQYLVECAKKYHHQFVLLTFEKPHDLQNQQRVENLRKELAGVNILWLTQRYHKRFSVLATAYDIFVGLIVGARACVRHNVKIVHARSYVPAVMAWMLTKVFCLKFVFDMRGFWADEKVDVGAWSRAGGIYKIAKWFERQFLVSADKVISLTHAAVEEMRTFPYLQAEHLDKFLVISTCVNLDLFSLKERLPQSENLTIGYVGGARMWYDFDIAIQYFKQVAKIASSAHFLIVNSAEHDFILQSLKEHQVPPKSYTLVRASHREVPTWIQKMDAALFFIRPFYSKIASAPTKLGEFLACGVPCVTMAGVGDMGRVLAEDRAGLILRDGSQDEIERSVRELRNFLSDTELSSRCRCAAEKHFSLYKAIALYDSLYKDLAGHNK